MIMYLESEMKTVSLKFHNPWQAGEWDMGGGGKEGTYTNIQGVQINVD